MTDHPFGDDRRAFWNDRYATEGAIFGLEPNQFVVAHLADVPPGRALDLGAGQGRNAVWLATRGHTVTAVDLSEVACAEAAKLAAVAGVTIETVAADLAVWEPPQGTFDLVLLSYLQVVPEMRRPIHERAARALAPGGIVFVIAHHRDNLEHGVGGPQHADLLFTEDDLASDFAGLTIERNEKVRRQVDRDDIVGNAIDVLFVAQRT